LSFALPVIRLYTRLSSESTVLDRRLSEINRSI
jgi:hypothetical protein